MTAEKSTRAETLAMLPPRALTVPGIAGTWVVAECFGRHEKTLAAELQDAGFDFFLPLVRSTKTSGRKRFSTYAPLGCLSGYVFAASDEPLQPDYLVPRGLYEFLDAHRSVYGMIEVSAGLQPRLVDELNQLHGTIVNNPDFADNFAVKGRECRVIAGPFMGREGIIDATGQGWAVLPITILGRDVPTRIDVKDLEPI